MFEVLAERIYSNDWKLTTPAVFEAVNMLILFERCISGYGGVSRVKIEIEFMLIRYESTKRVVASKQ